MEAKIIELSGGDNGKDWASIWQKSSV